MPSKILKNLTYNNKQQMLTWGASANNMISSIFIILHDNLILEPHNKLPVAIVLCQLVWSLAQIIQ